MPRAGLSPCRVADEAESVADEVGLDQLSMATVAARLGVRVPSLYKHIAGLDSLRGMLATRAKSAMADELTRATTDCVRDEAVVALATAYRSWARKYPARYRSTLRAPSPDDADDVAVSTRLVDLIFRVLSSFDLTADDAVDAARALRSALHGFVSLESDRGFELPLDVDRSFDRMVSGLLVALHNWPTED